MTTVVIYIRTRTATRAQRPPRKVAMAAQAMNEHELFHGPADRLNRILLHLPIGVEQCDVRGKFPPRQTLQAYPSQGGAKRSSKRSQPLQPFAPDENERLIAQPAQEGGRAIEPNLKRLCPHFSRGVTHDPNKLFLELSQEEQRYVQTF